MLNDIYLFLRQFIIKLIKILNILFYCNELNECFSVEVIYNLILAILFIPGEKLTRKMSNMVFYCP